MKAGGADAAGLEALETLGLVPGEQVRFRRSDRARWQVGVVACVERDGSLRVTDGNGAARTVPLAWVQVQGRRPAQWEPLADRAQRPSQLHLDFEHRHRRSHQ